MPNIAVEKESVRGAQLTGSVVYELDRERANSGRFALRDNNCNSPFHSRNHHRDL